MKEGDRQYCFYFFGLAPEPMWLSNFSKVLQFRGRALM